MQDGTIGYSKPEAGDRSGSERLRQIAYQVVDLMAGFRLRMANGMDELGESVAFLRSKMAGILPEGGHGDEKMGRPMIVLR
jgi:hypothetical protein